MKKTLTALSCFALVSTALVLAPSATYVEAQNEVETERSGIMLADQALMNILAWSHSGELQKVIESGLKELAKQPETRHQERRQEVIADHISSALGDIKDGMSYQTKIFEAFAKNPSQALGALAMKLAVRLGDVEVLEGVEAKLGMISGWCVVGPFENERGAGYAKNFGPEQAIPDFDASFQGKAGREVKWRPLPVNVRSGHLDFNAIMKPSDEVLAYAATSIEMAEAAKVTFRIASDEGFRIWVNGEELANTPRERNQEPSYGRHVHRDLGLAQNLIYAKLNKGKNLVVVKVTEAEGAWGLTLQASSEADMTLASAAEVSTWQNRMPAPERFKFTKAEESGVIDPLPSTLEERFVEALWELSHHAQERKERAAMKALQAIKDEFYTKLDDEGQLALLYTLAQASKSTAATSAGVDENAKRDILLEILKRRPAHYAANLAMVEHYTSTLQNSALAKKYADAAYAASPTFRAEFLLNTLLIEHSLVDVYFEKLNSLVAKSGALFDTRPYQHMAWFAERQGRVEAEIDYLEKWLIADGSSTAARMRLMEHAVKSSNFGELKTLVDQGKALLPLATTFHQFQARELAARPAEEGKTYEREALQSLQSALEIAPQNDDLLADAASMAKRVADSARRAERFYGVTEVDGRPVSEVAESHELLARNYYDRALAINPARSDVKRYIEFLDDKKPIWEERLQENIDEYLKEFVTTDVDNSLPLSVAYTHSIKEVNADGTYAEYAHMAWRVTSDQGRMIFRRFRAPARGRTQMVEARIWRGDGSVEESRIEDTTVFNDSINVGDILEIKFRSYMEETSFFGEFYGDVVPFAGPIGAPVGRMKQTWVMPESKEYFFYLRGDGPERSMKVEDGKRIVSYEAKDIAKIEQEQLSPPPQQQSPTVYVSTFKDWKSWGAWYWNLIERQVRSTPAIKDKVAELTFGLETEEQKVRAIYNFTVQKIRYNAEWEFGVHGYKPYEAGTIFERCIGDCKDKAILIVTMLREAGITAYPVIINLENLRGVEDITCPGPYHFNHAIAYVKYSDGSERFLDGTATFNAYDEPSAGDAGAQVVVITPEGGVRKQVPIYTAEENFNSYTATMIVGANGDVELSVRNDPKGQPAATLRGQFVNEGSRKATLEAGLSRYASGVSIGEIKASKLDDLETKPFLSFEATLDSYADTKGGTIEFRAHLENMDWTKTVLAYADKRKNDLVLPPLPGEKNVTTIEVPAGFSLPKLPDNVSIESEHFDYSLSFEKKDGKVVVTRWLAFKGAVIKAADYPAFRKAVVESAAADKTLLRFE